MLEQFSNETSWLDWYEGFEEQAGLVPVGIAFRYRMHRLRGTILSTMSCAITFNVMVL